MPRLKESLRSPSLESDLCGSGKTLQVHMQPWDKAFAADIAEGSQAVPDESTLRCELCGKAPKESGSSHICALRVLESWSHTH